MALSNVKKATLSALAAVASVVAPFNATAAGVPPLFGSGVGTPVVFGGNVVEFVGDIGESRMGNRIATLGRAAAHDWLQAIEQEGPTATYRLVVTPRPAFQGRPGFTDVVAVYGAVPGAAAWGPKAHLVLCVQEKIGSDNIIGTAMLRASDGEFASKDATPRRIAGGCEAYFRQPDVQLVVNGAKIPPVATRSAPRLAGY